jgi:hypothetical protein
LDLFVIFIGSFIILFFFFKRDSSQNSFCLVEVHLPEAMQYIVDFFSFCGCRPGRCFRSIIRDGLGWAFDSVGLCGMILKEELERRVSPQLAAFRS